MARSDIASMVNRSLGGGGVSVYSPTRRIVRPTGRVANAGTAQAILGGGGPVEQRPIGTSSFGGATATQRLPGWTQALGTGMPGAPIPGGFGTTLDQIRREAGITPAPEVEEPGGFWGTGIGKALGTAVNNPVGRGVMAGLEALNYPRRVVQSTVQEVADAFNGGDASFDDWTQQIGDESFGFDNMVPDTGNAFLDGLIGFGGDTLMDPFTFVAGAGVWSGIAGRTARAETAAAARAFGVRVGKLTVEETEERIARFGFSRFNNAARQELKDQLPGLSKNILDRGYHFKVPLTGRFFQVPGSQPVDWLLSRGAGRVRDTLSRSPLGGWMRYASNPNKMRDAVTTMVTRRPGPGMSFAQAAEVINWNNGAKLAERSFTSKAVKMADNAVKALGGGGGGRTSASDLFRTAEAQGDTVVHGYFRDVRELLVSKYGVHVPEFDGPYLPHYRTSEAQAILDAGDSQAARDFKALYKETDLDAVAESSLQRRLVPGTSITIAGQTHDIVEGTADELNRIWHQAMPDAKVDLIDTDFASVAHRYIKGYQENVRTIGGIKKVLGSKAGLLHELGDESMLKYLSDDDIDMFANKLTAPALKNQRNQVSNTLRQLRDDTHKGIKGVGGTLGVEIREAVGRMSSVTPQNKAVLDDALRTVSDLEAQVGVGKYHDRLVDGEPLHGPPGKPDRITREYEKAHKLFTNLLEAKTKRLAELQQQHGRLQSAAAAEARRLESQGNVGATPIQDELRRISAEAGATAHDMEWAQKIADRLDVTNKAQGVIDARLGDSDFINLAVADNLSPKSPGALGGDTAPPPVYVGPSPVEVSTDANAKVTQILGATDQRVAEVAARYEVQNAAVHAARERKWQADVNYGEAADTARRHLGEGRQYERTLKDEVDRTAGKPGLVERNLEYSGRLQAFQEGELPRLQRDFDAAKRPIETTRSNFDVEARRLQEIRDEQMAIARDLDTRRGGAETSTDFSWAAQHPIGDPVDPTPAITDRRQAAQQFIDLPDDALVTVYHATSRANADRLLAGRQIDPTMAGSSTGIATPPGELYVGGMYDQSGGYGDTTLAITVRKRDLRPSPEAGSSDYRDADWFAEFGDDAAVTQGLFLSRHLGATLKDLNDVADIRVATKGAPVTINRSPQRLPLTATQEATLRSQRRRVVRERNKWQRTPEGVAHTKATRAHATVTKTLEATDRQVAEITGKGGRFYVDESGAIEPKFTTQERWAQDLIEHRRSTLIPARDAAHARYDAATETLNRLERSGVDLWGSSSEARAAQREASAAFKARKQADYAIRDANTKLSKIRDVPDFGRIARQTDELDALLTKRASQQARLDELAHEMLTSGQTLRGFEDGIAGIDSQLTLQQTARDIAAEAPVTPYGAQVAATHRAEQARLDQIEAQFAAPRNWADPEELPAGPGGNLGAFEGKWENDPEIRKALELVGRVDGRRRLFDDMDEATDLANSAAAVRAASEPFTVPPKGTPAHTAVMEFSPASHGGAMGAVDRAQTVVANTQRVLDRHIGELVEAGALPVEYGDELFRQRLDLDRALDVHAMDPTAANRADVTAKATELGRLTELSLRYKQALEGGNEASPGLASFILARQLDDEAVSLRSQIDIGNARLASPAGGTAELGYSRGLARLNERAIQLSDNIEKELARAKAGGDWNRDSVKQWSAELDRLQRQRDGIGQPANGVLDDAVDSHAAYALDDLRDTNDAERIFDSNDFVDHRMQWPVRRNDELTAAIPHREAEIQGHMMGQQRLEEGIRRAHASGSTTVRYTPYNPEKFNGKVHVLPLAQAEQTLVANAEVIRTLQIDLTNKQTQQAAIEGTIDQRITLLERELSDQEIPPNPVELLNENQAIQNAAAHEQRALDPGELETIASNQARVDRLNRGQPLPQSTVAEMREEVARLSKVRDDFAAVMNNDAAHIAAARDPVPFLRGVAAGGGPISERSMAMLSDLVGAETAAAAKVWIHYLDETFAGRTAATADELAELVTDAVGTFGDNELIERMPAEESVASLAGDGTVSLDEMRDEFTDTLIASANRQRGETIRETLSMQSLFGTTYVDGPQGLTPRLIDAIADEPSHQLLTARLRSTTLDLMQRKGYDPRNAFVDEVADLRTRLGRVGTMRRGIDGNDEYLDVLLTGTPSAAARAEVRATLQAGSEALGTEQQQLLAQGSDLLNRLDPDRGIRNLEHQNQLGQEIVNTEDEMAGVQREIDRLDREAWEAERTYTERLDEAGMHLANARRKLHEARVNHTAHEAHRKQLVRAIRNNPGKSTPAMRTAIADLDALNQARKKLLTDVDQADIDAIDGYLTAYTEDLDKIEKLERSEADLTAQIAQADRNRDAMGEITKHLMADGFKIHAKGIGVDNPEGYAIDVGLAKAVENVSEVVKQHSFWTFLDRYTAFFKTYATARPGFHVRNALSATFMNLVDGVRIHDIYEGARLWRRYEREGEFWLKEGDQRIADAFDAVWASGAGGRYAEAGFGVDVQAGTKMYQRAMDNALTRWNQRLGSHVEGSARLAMALNTLSRGGDATQAMSRIAKFHFDYTEMSGLDRWARRLIPFWTFMSRNLPLQFEQMFTNPRMYLMYQNLQRNLGETADPATPDYWLSAGAFTVDKHAATREAPWYIAPDLPHLQAFEPLDALARGEFDKALLSDLNPALLAPAEAFITGKKAFSGANLEGYEQTSKANPFVPLFNLISAATPLNLTAKGGSGATVVDKRAAHIARSILPPWEFAERLLDPTGKREGRTDETIYRALGIPVRQLNEDLRTSTRRSQYYDRREAHDQQADLARM